MKRVSILFVILVVASAQLGAADLVRQKARQNYDSYRLDNSNLESLPSSIGVLYGTILNSNEETAIYVKYVPGEMLTDGNTSPIEMNERIKEVLFRTIRYDNPLIKYAIREDVAKYTVEATIVVTNTRDATKYVGISESRSYYKVIDNRKAIILGQDVYLRKAVMWLAANELESKDIAYGWER